MSLCAGTALDAMRPAVNVVRFLLVLGVLAVLWKSLNGPYEVPFLRDLQVPVPLDLVIHGANPTPTPPRPTVAPAIAVTATTSTPSAVCGADAPFSVWCSGSQAIIGGAMGEALECEG